MNIQNSYTISELYEDRKAPKPRKRNLKPRLSYSMETEVSLLTAEIDNQVGKKLRRRRLNLGVSQELLGSHLGVTAQQIQKFERGERSVGASKLILAAALLEVSVSHFFEGLPFIPTLATGCEMVSNYELVLFASSADGRRLIETIMKLNPKLRRRLIELIESAAACNGNTKT